MSTRAKLKAKIAQQHKQTEIDEALAASPSQEDGSAVTEEEASATEDAAAAPAAASLSEEQLHAEWQKGVKSSDFKHLARSYLDYFERVRSDPRRVPDLLQSASLTLSRFSTLAASSLQGATIDEELKDEYVFYRCAVMLTFTSLSLQARKVPPALHTIQQMIQMIWERFGGLGQLDEGSQVKSAAPTPTPANLFLVQPIQMLLGSMVDARLYAQAEGVVEALEELITEASKPPSQRDAAQLQQLPDVFRAPVMGGAGEVLPAHLRTRVYPPSDAIRTQAASMGFRAKFSNNLLLNLLVLTLRFRALYSDESRPDHAKMTAATWVQLVNALEEQERRDTVRPGFYSVDILPEAAESVESLNFLTLAENFLRRYELFFLPLKEALSLSASGQAVLPSGLLKIKPYERHLQITYVHGSILLKRAQQIQADAASPSPSSSPSSLSSLQQLYSQYFTLLNERSFVNQDLDNFMLCLSQHATALAFTFHKPFDALKKIKQALELLVRQLGDPAGEQPLRDPLAWKLFHQFYTLQGRILAEEVKPPQRAQALEAFNKAEALLQKHNESLKPAQQVCPLEERAVHVRTRIEHLAANSSKEDSQHLLSEIRTLLNLQRAYQEHFLRQKTALLAAEHSGSIPAGEEVALKDPKLIVECMKEIDQLLEGEGEVHLPTSAASSSANSPAENTSSALSLHSSLTPTQLQYLHTSYLTLQLDRLLQELESGGKAGQPSVALSRLARLVSAFRRSDQSAQQQAHAQEQREIASRASTFVKCASDQCQVLSAPPQYSFLACAACRAVTYCSKTCQKQHWPTHKPECKRRTEQKKTPTEKTA